MPLVRKRDRPPDGVQEGDFYGKELLFGKLGIDVDTQFSVRRSVHSSLFENQLPQSVLLCDGQDIVIIQDVLGGGDDLHRRFTCLRSGFLLSHKVSFGCLQLFDFPGQGGIPFGKHLSGTKVNCQDFLWDVLYDEMLPYVRKQEVTRNV